MLIIYFQILSLKSTFTSLFHEEKVDMGRQQSAAGISNDENEQYNEN